MGNQSTIVYFIRIGTYPVLQHHFTSVRTVSLTAGLDRVYIHKLVLDKFLKAIRVANYSMFT